MRHIRAILVTAALASLLLLAGCSSPAPTPSGGTGGTGATGSSAVAVSLQNFTFNPSDIQVAVGGTVTFTNNDTVQHNLAGDGWTSGVMAAGATFSHTFAAAGSFPIRCTIHPSMTANVTVK
jgi:plastocyanin